MRESVGAPGCASGCVCNVLAVLGEGEESVRATLDAAIELADAGNARLTLVKTCEPGHAYVWVAPFAAGGAYLPPEPESPEIAARLLSRLAEEVPASIPLTTLVVTADPQTSLLKLLRERHFGAIVGDADLFSRWWRLRRWLRREQLQIVLVGGDSQPRNAGVSAPDPNPQPEPARGRLPVSGVAAIERFATPR